MASNILPFPGRPGNDNGDDLPPQPGLRSFIVYDDVPEGCFAFQTGEESVAPHIYDSEYAIVSPTDTDPVHGELFLIQWDGGRRQLVELRLRPGRYHIGPNDEAVETSLWWAMFKWRTRNLAGKEFPLKPWAEGPYREENIRPKLVGMVVGIYEPDFRKDLRRAA